MIHIHLHTDGSVLDGGCRIKDVVKKAIEQGENAVGISDHGNMIKAFEFYNECVKNNIKPIIGCEFYTGESYDKNRYHLILIAKNDIGLRNLYKLNLESYENFYGKPRISYNMLLKHKEGLICTSACLGSEIARSFKNNEELNVVQKYKDLFGDDFYLEIQPNTVPGQIEYNKRLKEISELMNIKTIIACDVHYVEKEDYNSHDTMLCMQVQKKKNEERFKFSENSFYMKTNEEVIRDLHYFDKDFVLNSINNINEISEKCNVKIDTSLALLPKTGSNNEEKDLRTLCNEKFKERFLEGHYKEIDIKKVIERISYELSVICSKGFAGYFLIVHDIIEFCKKNDIFYGVGRGSVAGSEVAFILGITEVEPIRYGLYFERFLNPDRNTTPDKICRAIWKHIVLSLVNPIT